MYDLTVDENSKVVVGITPTADGVDWTDDYEIAVVPASRKPIEDDWQEPDVDGNQSGAWIGPGTIREQTRGDLLQSWWRPAGTTEIPWTKVYPRIRIT